MSIRRRKVRWLRDWEEGGGRTVGGEEIRDKGKNAR